MATIRRAGFGTVFELEDSKVGIGTDAATHTLQALGNIRSEAATDIGISSFTTYQGFIDKEARFTTGQINNQSQSGSTSGEIVIDGDVSVSSATTFTCGPQHLTVTDTFTLPSGDTNSRELKPTAGSLRFNQDFATLEFYTGNNWATVNTFTEMQNSPGNRGRGIFCGSYHPGLSGSNYGLNNIEYINIATKGNSLDFGDLVDAQGLMDGASSSTRMVVSGGYNSGFGGGAVMDIQYFTMASEGNALDFGDQTQSTYGTGASSSSTRALIMGGNRMPNNSPFNDGNDGNNTICTIEIATIGNAIDFGDLSARRAYPGACGDAVRMVIFGGYNNAVGQGGLKSSDTVNYASHGNGIDFGDATISGSNKAASNSTKGIWSGQNQGGGVYYNFIYSVSIQTLGDATDFGERTYDTYGSNMSSQTRMVMAGGRGSGAPSTGTNVIDFVEIATAGNAQDFGDAGYSFSSGAGSSDCHGGLGGF